MCEGGRGGACQGVHICTSAIHGRLCWYECTVQGGRAGSDLDVVQVAQAVQALGAGEILLNCIDNDGQNAGYDLPLIRSVRIAVTIPVIASSGAGSADHFAEVFESTPAEAALAASIFHRNQARWGRAERDGGARRDGTQWDEARGETGHGARRGTGWHAARGTGWGGTGGGWRVGWLCRLQTLRGIGWDGASSHPARPILPQSTRRSPFLRSKRCSLLVASACVRRRAAPSIAAPAVPSAAAGGVSHRAVGISSRGCES